MISTDQNLQDLYKSMMQLAFSVDSYCTAAIVREHAEIFDVGKVNFENLSWTSLTQAGKGRSTKGFGFSQIIDRSTKINLMHGIQTSTVKASNTSKLSYSDVLNGNDPSWSHPGYFIQNEGKTKFLRVPGGNMTQRDEGSRKKYSNRDFSASVILATRGFTA